MSDVVLKRGMERVEVKAALVTTEILRRTFRVSGSSKGACAHKLS